jgi:hypothetical protein
MFSEEGRLSKIKHFIPIMPVYFIIFSVITSFSLYYTLDSSENIFKLLTVPLFYFVAFMVMLCHFFAMFTNPGQVEKNKSSGEGKTNYLNNTHLFCEKCITSRPERTHHCKVCNRCVNKMDHHCPWIANCVGLKNQKFFYQFLFYATLGDFLAFICLLGKAQEINFESKIYNKNFQSVGEIFFTLKEPLIILVGLILSLSMTLAIGLLFVLQTRCILYNYTSIEEKKYKSTKDNPWYSSLNKMSNFKLVLGDNILFWFFPVSTNQEGYNYKPLSCLASQKDYLSLTDTIPEGEESIDNIHINLNLAD